MNPIRWHKPKWLPKLLAMPIPEPSDQAARILSIQRNIVLPVKLALLGVVFYYLFDFSLRWLDVSASPTNDSVPSVQAVVVETLQNFFIFYLVFNAVAAVLLILRRFPPRFVPWVVFTVGLVDGLLLAGLTAQTGGFGSNLFWVFPGLIIVNALSIPLAAPQIVLNLSLCACYLAAGILNISLTEPENPPLQPKISLKFSKDDIVDLRPLAFRLQEPSNTDELSRYLNSRLSGPTHYLLSLLSHQSQFRIGSGQALGSSPGSGRAGAGLGPVRNHHQRSALRAETVCRHRARQGHLQHAGPRLHLEQSDADKPRIAL